MSLSSGRHEMDDAAWLPGPEQCNKSDSNGGGEGTEEKTSEKSILYRNAIVRRDLSVSRGEGLMRAALDIGALVVESFSEQLAIGKVVIP